MGWTGQKDGGASKTMFIQSDWESKTHKARARRNHTGHSLNNRPLMYIDDDIQFPVLTPNILIHGQPIKIPEEQFGDDDKVIKKG